MDRPTKRPRLSFTPDSSEEVAGEWDLQTARAQNDLRLKSIFEGIFTKYGKDFTEVGDEIDLETGKIVVDNGHLMAMREENDTGNKAAWLSDDSEDDAQPNADLDEPTTPREPPNKATEHDGAGELDSDSDDSILGCALPQTCSPRPAARPALKVHTSLEQADQDPGPKDSLWQAPELPRLFSTPTADRHPIASLSPQLPRLNRERSPPGSGSLWSVPRRGRPRTEGKPKVTPSKRRPRAKTKSQSSPVVRDWSFAQRPDGNESDDPLQEFQPSPTPSRLTSIRRKPGKGTPIDMNKELAATPQSSGQTEAVSQVDRVTMHDIDKESQDEAQGHESGQKYAQVHVEDKSSHLQSDLFSRSHMQSVRKPSLQDTSTTSYDEIGPDEAKLIFRMRYLQKKPWQEIRAALPGQKMSQLFAFHHQWSVRRKNPPPLSAPLSETELVSLERLKDQPGLSWYEIRTRIPGRSHAEIELELMRLWMRDEVCSGENRGEGLGERSASMHNERVEDRAETEEKHCPPEPQVLVPQPVFEITPQLDPSTPGKKRSRAFEELLEEDESDGAISEASSPSKLSAIFLDSPSRSRQGSRTPSKASPVMRVKLAG